jgi:hypothetical protein
VIRLETVSFDSLRSIFRFLSLGGCSSPNYREEPTTCRNETSSHDPCDLLRPPLMPEGFAVELTLQGALARSRSSRRYQLRSTRASTDRCLPEGADRDYGHRSLLQSPLKNTLARLGATELSIDNSTGILSNTIDNLR